MLSHIQGALGLPVTQGLTTANNGQSLVPAQLWGAHLQAYRLAVGCLLTHVTLAGSHTLRKGRGVEVRVLRDVDPVVVHCVAGTLGCDELQSVGFREPLAARLLVTSHHTVEVVDMCLGLHGLTQLAQPVIAVEGCHLVLLCLTIRQDVQCQFFSEGSLVFKIENDSHISFAFSYYYCLCKDTKNSLPMFSQSSEIKSFTHANVCIYGDKKSAASEGLHHLVLPAERACTQSRGRI